jgi:hypothetical protein
MLSKFRFNYILMSLKLSDYPVLIVVKIATILKLKLKLSWIGYPYFGCNLMAYVESVTVLDEVGPIYADYFDEVCNIYIYIYKYVRRNYCIN